jgi:hypothetical protein
LDEKEATKGIMCLVLQLVNHVLNAVPIEELRTSNTFLLTAIDPLNRELCETDDWRKVETNRKLLDYLRGDLKELKEEDGWQIAAALSSSLSKTFTMITYKSIMDHIGIGSGYRSTGKADADQALIECVSERVGFEGIRWLAAVNRGLSVPMFYPAKFILDTVNMRRWREEDEYAEGLVKLCELIYWTVVYDAWSRERAAPGTATQWHYRNDVNEINKRLRKYSKLDWPDTTIVDDYTIYALLIRPFLEFRMWSTQREVSIFGRSGLISRTSKVIRKNLSN